MRTARIVRLMLVSLTCVFLLWAAALWLLPASQTVLANPGSLFVTVTGSGTACTQAQPCGLQTALGRAVDGDSVYVGAGTYTGSGAAVVTITTGITLYGGWNGAASGARRVLLSRAEAEEAENIVRKLTYMELTVNNDFMGEFTSALFLPHTDTGLFPSVKPRRS